MLNGIYVAGGNEAVEKVIIEVLVGGIERYVKRDCDYVGGGEKGGTKTNEWIIKQHKSVILEMLRGLERWSEEKRAAKRRDLYAPLCSLVVVEDRSVRAALAGVLRLFEQAR